MKFTSYLAASAAAMLLTCTLGCGPAAPTDVNVDTSTSSNTTAAGGNVTTGTDTPVAETP